MSRTVMAFLGGLMLGNIDSLLIVWIFTAIDVHKEPISKSRDNTCIYCGEIIPEGRMVSPRCEKKYS